MIRSISWPEIHKIWNTELWPNRTSAIEPNSAMLYLNGYDISNMNQPASFFGFFWNNQLVGVNSGHKCSDGSYRSRGLWVNKQYRKQGIGTKLLFATIGQAKLESSVFVWSFPRQTSWATYKRAGFNLTSDWQPSETSEANAYCRIDIE